MTGLEASYGWCRRIARSRAKNFYYAFAALDSRRRDALCSIYAFMRRCDDLSDEPGASMANLDAWRVELDNALGGRPGPGPIWPAFVETTRRYGIPAAYFHDMIEGVSSDCGQVAVETFDQLYGYCYRVASVAGLSLARIFGCSHPEGLKLAEKCGVAFQITNILRDVREDHAAGRVYLPAEDMARFGVTRQDLAAGAESPALIALLRFEAGRAWDYYRQSRPLLGMVDPDCRASLWAIIEIYSRLLRRIEDEGFPVLRRRVRVPGFEKLGILARALCARFTGLPR